MTAGKKRPWFYSFGLAICGGLTVFNCAGDSDFSTRTVIGFPHRAIALGNRNSCIITNTKNVRCWGQGAWGVNGTGATGEIGDSSATEVGDQPEVQLGGEALQISSTGQFACALLVGGNVRCWGYNTNGQLGYGHTTPIGNSSANDIINAGDVSLGGEVVQIAAGAAHSCALLATGKIKCWGLNSDGQLGYGDETQRTSPGDELPFSDFATQVSAAYYSTCALFSNGKARCWGDGTYGRLGQGHSNDIGDDPGEIENLDYIPIEEKIVEIAAGGHATCARLESGNVKCWGYSFVLGTGSFPDDQGDEPGEIESLSTVNLGDGLTAKDIEVGLLHACAITNQDRLRCWGSGTNGQLGYNSTNHIGDQSGDVNEIASAGNVPVLTVAEESTLSIRAFAVGEAHTCAILSNGSVRCWGEGDNGRLGYGNTNDTGDTDGPTIRDSSDIFLGTGITALIQSYFLQ